LFEAHAGRVPVFLCLRRPGGEIIFVETHEKFSVTPSAALEKAVDDLFGEETWYARVDTALPERQRRQWERRENGNGAEE